MRHAGLRVFAIAAAALVVPPVAAQDAEVFSDFLSCDPLVDATERLACYDAVLKQYKVRYGLVPGTADALAAADDDRRRAVPAAPVSSAPLAAPPGDASAVGRDSADERARTAAVRRGGSVERPASVDDVPLPLETTITGFNMNLVGDFRLRIAEGWVFERAGGPDPRADDLTGLPVTLSKNFLGQWRLKIAGDPQPLWVRPVE